MQTIWKFSMDQTGVQAIEMPTGAKIVHVAVQGGAVCLWAQVNPQAVTERRLISVYGTGQEMPDDPGHHVGTFLLSGGQYVFHVYDATL